MENENIDINNPEENLLKDLEESLSNTIKETLETLDLLLASVKKTSKDKSEYVETKKIVDLAGNEISNIINKNIDELSKQLETSLDIKSSEEE